MPTPPRSNIYLSLFLRAFQSRPRASMSVFSAKESDSSYFCQVTVDVLNHSLSSVRAIQCLLGAARHIRQALISNGLLSNPGRVEQSESREPNRRNFSENDFFKQKRKKKKKFGENVTSSAEIIGKPRRSHFMEYLQSLIANQLDSYRRSTDCTYEEAQRRPLQFCPRRKSVGCNKKIA